MALVQSLIDIVPSSGLDPDSGLVSRSAYGYEVSFTHATLPAGYALAAARPRERGDLRARRGRAVGLPRRPRVPPRARRSAAHPGARRALEAEPRLASRRSCTSCTARRGACSAAAACSTRTSARTPRIAATATSASGRPTARRATCTDGSESFPVAPDDHPLLARGKPLWDAAVAAELPRQHGSAGTNKAIRVAGESFAILYSERVGPEGAAALPRRRAAELRRQRRGLDVRRRPRALREGGRRDPRARQRHPLGARRARRDRGHVRGAHAGAGRPGRLGEDGPRLPAPRAPDPERALDPRRVPDRCPAGARSSRRTRPACSRRRARRSSCRSACRRATSRRSAGGADGRRRARRSSSASGTTSTACRASSRRGSSPTASRSCSAPRSSASSATTSPSTTTARSAWRRRRSCCSRRSPCRPRGSGSARSCCSRRPTRCCGCWRRSAWSTSCRAAGSRSGSGPACARSSSSGSAPSRPPRGPTSSARWTRSAARSTTGW